MSRSLSRSSASCSVSINSRRLSVRRTAAKLDAAIFWKIAIRKPKRPPLVALTTREIEAFFQILAQLFVEQPFAVRHHEGFGVNPPSREQW